MRAAVGNNGGECGNNFNGDFDGNGCSITGVGPNLSDFSSNNFGVGFITIGEDGYVHDLTIEGDIDIDVNNSKYLGGIAGVLTYATISDCTNSYSIDNNSGAVTATSTSTSVDGARLGGIEGQMQNASTISECSNSAAVTASG